MFAHQLMNMQWCQTGANTHELSLLLAATAQLRVWELQEKQEGRKGRKWMRDVDAALAQSEAAEIFNVCLWECVCPIEEYVYKSQSQAVCVLQGRCFLQCNLSLWWNVWTTSDSTPLKPPTHSISHCKQHGFARDSWTGQVESLYLPKITECRKCFKIRAYWALQSAKVTPEKWY